MPSSTTVDTGRTIPNPNPAVKIAKKQAYIGLIFSTIEFLFTGKLVTAQVENVDMRAILKGHIRVGGLV
jgi:hypothetical protein